LALFAIGLSKYYRNDEDESKKKLIKEFFQSMDIYLKRIKNTKNAPDIQKSLHLALSPTFFCGINNLYMGKKKEAFCIFDIFFDLWKKIFPESKVMKIENDEDLISNMFNLVSKLRISSINGHFICNPGPTINGLLLLSCTNLPKRNIITLSVS